MSANEIGNVKESFVKDENKIYIEETSINLDCVKKEPNDEAADFEEDSQAAQYRMTVEYETNIKVDHDNLIGFVENDVITETDMIKLEATKEKDDDSFSSFHCSKCNGIYNGYCLKCSSLICILNKLTFVKSEFELNTIPIDILEIKETFRGNGVYLLRTLPINIIFGPFEGILGIEGTTGYNWKIIDNKLKNIKSGNWMKNIASAPNSTLKNLDILQIDNNLYFRTNREIVEGEELLIYYDDDEVQRLDNGEECLYTPQKQERLPKIFACTICYLGFGSNKCLVEHKRKSCPIENGMSIKEFIFVECHYCKMWLEKGEHEEYHVTYCMEKHHGILNDYSGSIDRSGTDIEKMEEDTKDDKRICQVEIWSRPYDRSDNLQLDTKNNQCFSDESRLNECILTEGPNEQIPNTIETSNKNPLNKQRYTCDICMAKFIRKDSLKMHIKNKHTDDGSAKDYKCTECCYQTNTKSHLQLHSSTHTGIKAFQCDICMNKFTRKDSLTKHTKNKHTTNESSKRFKCEACSYQTNRKNHFQAHINKHKGIKQFECNICLMKFSFNGNLKKHIKNMHADDGSTKDYKCLECTYQSNSKSNYLNHLNRHKGIKPYHCDICMARFTLKFTLKTHMKDKHRNDGSDKDYKCLKCSYQTNHRRNFQNHLNTHSAIKPFECDICMVRFSQKNLLKVHVKNKHTDFGSAEVYKCLECSYHTNDKRNFQEHLNKHTGIKQHKCEICMMEFFEKRFLKRHIKNKHINDGTVKDYKCPQCSYETKYKCNFQRHLNNHKSNKQYQCDICMAMLSEKSNLLRHIKYKHADNGSEKDHKCSECSYQTNYKADLQKHVNKHRGIKPFSCDICMVKFATKMSLKAHVKYKHTENVKQFQCEICTMKFTWKSSLRTHVKKKHTNNASAKDTKKECV